MECLGRTSRDSQYSERYCFDDLYAAFLTSYYGSRQVVENCGYARAVPQHVHGYLSIKKYDILQGAIQKPNWDLSLEWAIRHWQPTVGGSLQASIEYVIQAMNKQASPGAPWVLVYHSKKRSLRDQDILLFTGKSWIVLRDHPLHLLLLYNSKEEVRARLKVLAGKLRGFTGVDIVAVICSDRICRPMNERFYDSVGMTWNCVGMCKYFLGTHRMFQRVNRWPNAYELDGHNWDACVPRQAMYEMVLWRLAMLRDPDADTVKRLAHIYEDFVDSHVILTHGEVIRKHTGNPSGSPNTIVDNTVILFRMLVYAWLQCYERFWHPPMLQIDYRNYNEFMYYVEAAIGGDDNTFTVSDVANQWFNARNISIIWKELNIETHAPHDAHDVEFEPKKLIDCHFFSMAFKDIGGIIVPVPDRNRMHASILYAGRGVGTPIWSLLRAYAIRIETFYDVEMRQLISAYIVYLHTHYRQELLNSREPTYRDVQTVYKTDAEIEALYLGYEAVSNKSRSPQEKELIALCEAVTSSSYNLTRVWHDYASKTESSKSNCCSSC